MLLPSVPANLVNYLGLAKADLSLHLSSLLLGLLRALGGCLLAIGITALLIINGPLKRGETWASWALLILIGVSEGINASQMWRFGSPYYGPLAVVALTILGLAMLPKPGTKARSPLRLCSVRGIRVSSGIVNRQFHLSGAEPRCLFRSIRSCLALARTAESTSMPAFARAASTKTSPSIYPTTVSTICPSRLIMN